MILNAQNTVNKTVSESVYACICMCTYFTIFDTSLLACHWWPNIECWLGSFVILGDPDQ